MPEYFVIANSFAAPFFSDTSEAFVMGSTPEEALASFVRNYDHPCGLYAAMLYADATAYHKKQNPLLKWLCNHELEKLRLTKDKGAYSFLGQEPGRFEIDGKEHCVENPKMGRIVKID